jgi:hypothetical protein
VVAVQARLATQQKADRGEVQTTKVVKTISEAPLTVEEWAAKYGAERVT